jgi:hypothetical protein
MLGALLKKMNPSETFDYRRSGGVYRIATLQAASKPRGIGFIYV